MEQYISPEAEGISQMASMPGTNEGPSMPGMANPVQGPQMQGPPMAGPEGGPGGAPGGPGQPGVDTPQEQKAIQLLTQAAVLMREAANVEPSIRHIVDDTLQRSFLAVTKHYGIEQEGKLAMQQSQLTKNRMMSSRIGGGMAPPTGGGLQ